MWLVSSTGILCCYASSVHQTFTKKMICVVPENFGCLNTLQASLRSWRYGEREIKFWRRSRQKRAAKPREGISESLSSFSSRLRRLLVITFFRVRLQYRQLRRLITSLQKRFNMRTSLQVTFSVLRRVLLN